MNKNYLNSKNTKANRISLKQSFLALFFMLSVSFAFAQETATIVTTSDSGAWNAAFTNLGGQDLSWEATGPISPSPQIVTGDAAAFDFSANTGNAPITITITSPDNFDHVTVFLAPARDIISIDISNIENIENIELPNNQLSAIDLSANVNLTDLVLDNNVLTSIDLFANILLEFIELQNNQLTTLDVSASSLLEKLDVNNNNLTSINVSGNPNLASLNLSSNDLTAIDIAMNTQLMLINLNFNLLDIAGVDQVLNDVNAYGTGTLGYILSLQGNPGRISSNGVADYEDLIDRDWTIIPPVYYDFGDAPDSYSTFSASGGAQHIVPADGLKIGLVVDNEADGIPSIEADGDDINNINDEDGVLLTDLDGILTSTDNFSLDVAIVNNISTAATLYGWIDFDGSGTFDADEFTSVIAPNGGGSAVTLTWSGIIANGIVEGKTYARFRITTDALTASDFGGIANNGEVEDYTLDIELDTDGDGIPDIADVDSDNDGILDVDEDNGVVDRDTDGNGIPDRIELDADADGCFDVTEAGFTDANGNGMLGDIPITVDANGQVTSGADGYTPPNDLNVNGTPDFQESGAPANITTQPVDQDLIIGTSTFSVITDLVAGDESYQWEESQDGGVTWVALADAGDYAGTTTADLMVTNSDVTKLTYRYRVIVNNIAYACDPTTTSVEVTYITPDDFDLDGVYDIVDFDDDNDGILDVDEDNGVVDRDTDGNGIPDRIELDADADGCFDVTEAGFTDVNGNGMLGDDPIAVDVNGQVTSGSDGYTLPIADLNTNGTPDFQEAGAPANITTQPVDQDLIIGTSTFSVITDLVAGDESYQWEESQDGGATWVALADAGDYAGTTTADLMVTNSDVSKLTYRYRVIVSNIAFACDPTTTSVEVTYITPIDTDGDLVYDIVDFDDDNDGILDVDEDNGVVDRDTDGNGIPDRIELDADADGCFDVTEAGFTDANGNGMLGDIPIAVDVNGQVTSGSDGYTLPVADLNTNGTPDFQESGAPANITTQPVDQIYVLAGASTFSVITDLVAGDESYQWEESIDNGITWNTLVDGGDYAGVTTADLTISTPDFSKVNNRYRVLVSNIAYACDPVTPSTDATFITPGDFDKDGIFDVVDVDDDNDGILDTVEENGDVNRDTDGDGALDTVDLDADGDGCFDVTEAGFTDDNGDGMLGDFPIIVDVNGQVTSGSDGYTPPNDLDGSLTPDFQEAGAAATITTEPTDQPLIIGVSTFSVIATADTYQWEESQDGGTTWVVIVNGGDYADATTSDLKVTNSDVSKLNYRFRVIASDIAFACDPTITSVEVGYFAPDDFDLDGVYDIVDVDDDNDGILDVDEDNGIVDRDTDGDGTPDRIQLDADADGCFDVTEAGFTDVNGNGMLGDGPIAVDVSGQVTSGTDGYTPPNDLDGNGTPDFQEAGAIATITTEPTDQDLFPTLSATFTVIATADTYQWEESIDAGATWTPIAEGGNYSGTTTTSLTISNLDVAMRDNLYRVNVNNIAYACDPITSSAAAGFISLLDTDGDNVPDLADVDDDNDGILDAVEDNGIVDRDTDGDGTPDRIQLDADGDGCFDVLEAGFTDVNGNGMLGDDPIIVDVDGQVTSGTDGYTAPNDLDNNGIPDFQEAGAIATISVDPVDQDFVIDGSATFTVTTTGDTYQWQESTDGVNWVNLVDGGDYAGTITTSLTVSNNNVIDNYFSSYRVVVSSIAYACDNGTTSLSATYNTLTDTDNDGVFDIVDLDADNDGILDTVEGDGDTDGDGVLDRLSLDADGDNCPDVTEAGFTNNGNDMLGTANPAVVDSDGLVISASDGYTTPNDLDGNNIFDFQQHGAPSEIIGQPEDFEIGLGDNVEITADVNATYIQWQVSTDNGSNWSNLVNDGKYDGVTTSTLKIMDARGRLESNLYRVMLTSPDYACDPNPELYSRGALLSFDALTIPNAFTPNGDGKNELFIIPGLDQYPNWSIQISNRYGSKVYSYSNKGSANPQWWDGYSSGDLNLGNKRVPAGTYFYILHFNGENRKPVNGWVYITY